MNKVWPLRWKMKGQISSVRSFIFHQNESEFDNSFLKNCTFWWFRLEAQHCDSIQKFPECSSPLFPFQTSKALPVNECYEHFHQRLRHSSSICKKYGLVSGKKQKAKSQPNVIPYGHSHWLSELIRGSTHRFMDLLQNFFFYWSFVTCRVLLLLLARFCHMSSEWQLTQITRAWIKEHLNSEVSFQLCVK